MITTLTNFDKVAAFGAAFQESRPVIKGKASLAEKKITCITMLCYNSELHCWQ